MPRSASKTSASKQQASPRPLEGESPVSTASSAPPSLGGVVPSPDTPLEPDLRQHSSPTFPPEEEEDTRSASERDGELMDASSVGESVPGASRPIETTDLVNLQGTDRCRQIYLATLAEGSKARLCCGRSITDCRQHAKKRLSGKDHGLPHWYVHARAAHGSVTHGRTGENCYTQEEYYAILSIEMDEMTAIARELEDGSDDDENASDNEPETGRAPVVNFEGVSTFQTPPRPAPRGQARRLPMTHEADSSNVPTSIAAQISRAVQLEFARSTSATALLTPARVKTPHTSNPSDVVVLVEDPSTDEDEEEQAPTPGHRQSKPKRHAQGRKDIREWLGLLSPKGDRVIHKESSDGTLALKAGWKFKKYFSTRSEAHSWLAVGTDPSDSDSSFSSDSEKNSSSSSSSSGPHCHRPKRSSKSRKNHKKRPSYRGTDPSTGKNQVSHEEGR
jgi:hypothetical protein